MSEVLILKQAVAFSGELLSCDQARIQKMWNRMMMSFLWNLILNMIRHG